MPTLEQTIERAGIKTIQLAYTHIPHGGATQPTQSSRSGTYVWYQITTFPLSVPAGNRRLLLRNKHNLKGKKKKHYHYPTAKSRLDLRALKHPRGITTQTSSRVGAVSTEGRIPDCYRGLTGPTRLQISMPNGTKPPPLVAPNILPRIGGTTQGPTLRRALADTVRHHRMRC